MSAGLTSRSITATTVALPRIALAGLLAVVLLVGGLFGVVARSGFDTLTGTATGASVATSGLATRMLAERAQIAVGRGPLAGDPGTGGARPAGAGHAADHIGLSERLFPITTTHHLEHGPLP